jgi:hypothetical protein
VTLVTITDVEIATVGMQWPAMTGPVTITLEHLADARAAAMDDPHILLPRLKIGHVDPRFADGELDGDPLAYKGPFNEDGNPAFGKVGKLKLVNDGAVLLGDYIDVPEWLGNAAAWAYPNRSPEWISNYITPGGKRYSMVITALALLGEEWPAIADLEDLQTVLEGGPAALSAAKTYAMTTRRDTMPDAPAAATASVDAVQETFWNEFAQDDRYWWWPRELWIDAGQIIADDDEGHLYRVPFSTDADGNVTFDDPVRGVLDFRDVPEQVAAAVRAAEGPTRVFVSAASARPKDRARAATTTTKGAEMSNVSTALLEKLGVDADATEEEQLAALASYRGESQEPKPDDGDGGEGGGTPADEPAAQVPVAASVDPAALAQLQEDARLGREAREEQLKAARSALVDERIRTGCITAASRQAHLDELAKGGKIEAAHKTYLEGLTPVIPVGEQAVTPTTNTSHEAQVAAGLAAAGVNVRKES